MEGRFQLAWHGSPSHDGFFVCWLLHTPCNGEPNSACKDPEDDVAMDSPTALCIDDRPQMLELMNQVLAVGLEKPTTNKDLAEVLLGRMISNNEAA
jgi:hypothetical protein